jgi:hypothetical protein
MNGAPQWLKGHSKPSSAGVPHPNSLAASLVVLTQQLAGFSIDEMYAGAGRTGDGLVLVFGNIWIVIQLVLDVEAGCRAPENEVAHPFNLMTPRHQTMI